MKKITLIMITCLVLVNLAYAQTKKIVTTTETQTAKLADIIAKKKAELNGTQWTIELKSMTAGPKTKAEADAISFADEKIASKNLEGLGFVPTNFSVRLEEDGTVIWETMQTSEKEGMAFWRGDIGPDGIMRGVLSRQDKKGKTYDFNFVSVKK